MQAVSMTTIATAIALSVIAFSATPGAATAGPVVPPGHYCLSYDEGGTDCSFTTYRQCEATASGIGAECYGSSFRDHDYFQGQGRRAGDYRDRTY